MPIVISGPQPPQPPQKAHLTVDSMRDAIPKIQRRIKDLESFDLNTIRKRWDPLIKSLQQKVNGTLQEILGHGTVEYNEYYISSLDTLRTRFGASPDPLPRVKEGYREGIEESVLKLNTLKELFEERVSDISTDERGTQPHQSLTKAAPTRRVFVVHGRDEGAKETVARFVSQLSLDPIILHEKPSQGRTIVEKFEAHSTVDYALVLLTPDDIGYPANAPDQARPRARQNVMLELGFFLGTLGRDRVCVLHCGDVEIPSDYQGVVYVPLDESGAWRLTVAREMKVVGIDVDLNDAM